jgi:23S rRNA (cytidine1920-2'-O)/16S rRNA (cytidine1409-2'-O)-methyltransferase
VRLLKADGQLLMLVKPQFELQPPNGRRVFSPRDAVHFEFAEKRLRDCCAELGVDTSADGNHIAGGDGNREAIHGKRVTTSRPMTNHRSLPPRQKLPNAHRAPKPAPHAAHEL